MKIRKEFLIFGVVIAISILLAIIYFATHNKSYNSYNVENKGSTTEPDVPPEGSTGEPSDSFYLDSDGWIGSSGTKPSTSQSDEPVGTVSEPTGDEPGVVTPEPGDTSTPSATDPEEPSESDVVDELPDEDQGDGDRTQLDNEQLAYVLAYYICGLEHDMSDLALSPAMLEQAGALSGSEPFASLEGNTYFEDLTLTDNVLSFTIEDGTVYRFNISVTDGLVTGIEFAS